MTRLPAGSWPFRATAPAARLPRGACDCHLHLFGPFDRFPLPDRRPYTPGLAALDDAERMLRQLGLERAVLVQPSVYGVDLSCLLEGLEKFGARARGVIVLDPCHGPDRLRSWHDLGVRGARLNAGGFGTRLDADAFMATARTVAGRIAGLGWHLDLHVPLAALGPTDLAHLAARVPVVLDHLAYVRGDRDEEVERLLTLLRTGRVWVKLSGFYRVDTDGSGTGSRSMSALVARLVDEAPDRLLWGSDWPHTPPHGEDPRPKFRDVDSGGQLAPLLACADPARLRRILVDNPATLYGFAPPPPSTSR